MKNGHVKLFVRKRPNRSVAVDIVIIMFLFIVAAIMAMPIVYSISNSLKPHEELWVFPPKFFVRNPTLQNFRDMPIPR